MKNTKLTDTNYLFLSTTIACLENSLMRGETLAKLVDAGKVEQYPVSALNQLVDTILD